MTSNQIIVVDNNPEPGEKYRADYPVPFYPENFAAESLWLNNLEHPKLIKLRNEDDRSHGAAFELARTWCNKNGIRYLSHIEPDCVIRGRKWLDKQMEAIRAGSWVAGVGRTGIFADQLIFINPTSTTYDLDPLCGIPFQLTEIDYEQPELVALIGNVNPKDIKKALFEPFPKYWDHGAFMWWNAYLNNAAKFVTRGDLVTCQCSSVTDYWTRERYPMVNW